jgi:hypothetical protein
MGNAQSLTRTSGALDSFVAELGSDLIYDKRYHVGSWSTGGPSSEEE